MIDPLSGNHVQFPVSNRSTAHNSEWNANLPSRWPFGWSPFPCRARNRKFFNDTRCCDARHKREKIVETDKANNVRGDNSPPFLPCWFPRRVKLEIDVLKKKKRKNWRLKFHSFPAEENRWMAALIVPSRIFGYAPLRVCVCERRSSCTQIASDYLHRDPLTSGIRSPFIRAASAFPTQHRWKKEAAILPPLLAVSLSTSKYSLQIIREIFLYWLINPLPYGTNFNAIRRVDFSTLESALINATLVFRFESRGWYIYI